MKAYIYTKQSTVIAVSPLVPLLQQPDGTIKHEIDRYEEGMKVVYEDMRVMNYYASRMYNKQVTILENKVKELKWEVSRYQKKQKRIKECSDYEYLVRQRVLYQMWLLPW